MKCPKCDYLGFETGDRCKNCGYDFSLAIDPSAPGGVDVDLTFRPSAGDTPPVSIQWDDTFDGTMTALPPSPGVSDPVLPASEPSSPDASAPVLPASEPPSPDASAPVLPASDPPSPDASAPLVPASEPTASRAEPAVAEISGTDQRLPLFSQAFDDPGDEPLIKVPAAPRPPLAVRRTPRVPRLRTVPKASRPFAIGPALEFWDKMPDAPAVESASEVRARTAARLAAASPRADVSGAARRLGAAAVDHLLLSAIDLSVVYFTLRMAGLPMAEWTALPPVPLVTFLLLVKLSYFCAFTAVGGQTIGKMAARIRVVTAENASVDGACALKRALAGAVSASVLGLGYLPALVGEEHLAIHDYVTHTRVIALPS